MTEKANTPEATSTNNAGAIAKNVAVTTAKLAVNVGIIAVGAACGCWLYNKLTGGSQSGDTSTTTQ